MTDRIGVARNASEGQAEPPKRIGVVDTTFSRVNMGELALDELRKHPRRNELEVRRVTVPGVKDLPAAARRFFDQGCDAVIACGMVGPEDVDKTCGHEASLGLMWLRCKFGKPLLEVFVHMDEVAPEDEKGLFKVVDNRTREHAVNCVLMLLEPETLVKQAGTGQRQGFEDAGPVRL
ncbi:MAG TPA: riboflavin synthase [Candidatus Thermoplasmatota archaeon]|nr:riboflavin synthase [Candidatus Thermoplasmatota archaeon]